MSDNKHKDKIKDLKNSYTNIDQEFSKDKDAIDALLPVCKELLKEVINLKAEVRVLKEKLAKAMI